MKSIAAAINTFVDQVWLPDVVLPAKAYRKPYEVGPLARTPIGYTTGSSVYRRLVDRFPVPTKDTWPTTARGWGTVEAPRGPCMGCSVHVLDSQDALVLVDAVDTSRVAPVLGLLVGPAARA